MRPPLFYLLLTFIAFSGLLLRFHQYSVTPPFGETSDELHYAWAGATWLKTGTPKSWSWFESYEEVETIPRAGINWGIKSPLIEKPPLYFLASGASLLFLGSTDLFETRLAVIRVLPVIVSFFTIFLLGWLGKNVISSPVGLVAATLYATTPTVVLANRLSLTENFLTPLALGTLLLATKDIPTARITLVTWATGILCGLTFLTKQAGAALTIALTGIYLSLRQYRKALILIGCLSIAVLLFLGFAAYYDWQLFWQLQKELQQHHALRGLPEVFFAIFRFPQISGRDKPFLDASLLLGYLFLFTAPVWLVHDYLKPDQRKKFLVMLAFPFAYLTLLVIGESGATPYTYWGWYAFPLYPFALLLLSFALSLVWKTTSYLTTLLFIIGIGSSSIRFFLLLQPPTWSIYWQWFLGGLLLSFTGVWLFGKLGVKRLYLMGVFMLYIVINIYTVLHLAAIYPSR